jgi:glycerate dehydrogenase
MVFALLLEFTNRVGHHARSVEEGRWQRAENFCYWAYPLTELAGLTMGIVGCGRIGQATARIATAFGMRVIGHDENAASFDGTGIAPAGLDELFARSDVVSLHCPLTPATRHLVNAARVASMKPTAVLINTSRGPLVNEQELADALNTGRIAGACLDVLSVEPPAAGNPLIGARNCIITPHIAWATRSARGRLLGTGIENLIAFAAGRPQNIVNVAALADVRHQLEGAPR